MLATKIGSAEAKAGFSALIRNVDEKGAEYIVTLRDRPVAMIVPMRKSGAATAHGFGSLAGKRPVASREEEKSAFAEAMETRHE